MRRTIPQVLMLNHAAWLEQENADIRYQHKKKVEEWMENHTPQDPVIDQFHRPMSELSGDQLNAYLSDWSGFE